MPSGVYKHKKRYTKKERYERYITRRRKAKKILILKREEDIKKINLGRNVVIIKKKQPVNLVREYLAKKAKRQIIN